MLTYILIGWSLCILTPSVVSQRSKKDIFYNKDSFRDAYVGQSTLFTTKVLENGATKYSYAKIESEEPVGDSTTTTEQSQPKALGAPSPKNYLTLTILQDRYLMADRITLAIEAPEAAVGQPIKIKGKMTDFQEATMPLLFKDCEFNFTLRQKTDTELSFQLHGFEACPVRADISLQTVNYVVAYYVFLLSFVALVSLQIFAFSILRKKAREDFERYLKKISLHGMLLDTTMNSCILYHFGVLLPVDIRLVIPQVILMISSSFFWMQKLVHSIHNQPNQRCTRLFQFVCTMIMMVGGLYIPSIDKKSLSLLAVVVIPLLMQIINSFNNRVGSFSVEYNILFKIPQLLIVGYIYGWPLTPSHLLPTYPVSVMHTAWIFSVLSIVSFLQRKLHPRFYIRTIEDYRRLKLTPKQFTVTELSQMDSKAECSICLTELLDSPEEDALLTACGHTFHRACLLEWLVKTEQCPICRQTVSHPEPKFDGD